MTSPTVSAGSCIETENSQVSAAESVPPINVSSPSPLILEPEPQISPLGKPVATMPVIAASRSKVKPISVAEAEDAKS